MRNQLPIVIRLRGLLVAGLVGALALAVDGCASTYFKDAGPAPEIRHELARLPFSEYWTGIVFNGEKIGFTHFAIRRDAGTGNYEIRSEASFVLRFLGIEKKIQLKSRDVIEGDLGLVDFAYEYHIDGSEMRLTGRRAGAELAATIVTGGSRPHEQRLPVDGKLYPSSVIALYPVLHGLEIGREHHYRVYSGETQAIREVTQRIAGYESSELFLGNAFKVETAMGGQSVTTWIGPDGRPVFELAMRGVMISFLEDSGSATRYLALASLNKKESLVEYSIVRPDRPIEHPRAVSAMGVALSGTNRMPPTDAWQRCAADQGEITCVMGRTTGAGDPGAASPEALRARYLQPSIAVQSNDPAIRRLAEAIVGGAASTEERISRILRWLDQNIEKAPIDVFSALDVLQQRKAECQGHAYLYIALARAAGIPTRMVNGLVYSEQFNGFLYHSWAESLDGASWRVVDPTFGQAAADATHIKLIEGENLAELLPLLDWVGKVKIRVLEVEHRKQ